VKTVLKLIVVGLMMNALWRLGTVYVSFYEFKDSVRLAAMREGQSDDVLRQKILELASTYDVPLAEEDIAIRREQHHTYVESDYKTRVKVFPGYEYEWPFKVDVDAYVIVPPAELRELAKP
jgi:hypothetical protein